MITNREELLEYLNKDRIALGINRKRPKFGGGYVWKFQIALRKHEFFQNTKPRSFRCLFWKWRHYVWGVRLGFSIPCNVCGAGLRINHYGLIVINPEVRIGQWCDIHQGVNIGTDFEGNTPTLGDNVWIGPGAKLYGGIEIGDNTVIGANSVVNQSFAGVTVAGCPAKEISQKANPYARADKS